MKRSWSNTKDKETVQEKEKGKGKAKDKKAAAKAKQELGLVDSSSSSATSSSSSSTSATLPQIKTEDGPQCGICLDEVSIQGLIDICKHTFCFECIRKWSDVSNTCPMCKARFKYITKKHLDQPPNKRQKKSETIKVRKKDAHFEESDTEMSQFLDEFQNHIQTVIMSLVTGTVMLHDEMLSSSDEDSERTNPENQEPVSHTIIDLTTSDNPTFTTTRTPNPPRRSARSRQTRNPTSGPTRRSRRRSAPPPTTNSTSSSASQEENPSLTSTHVFFSPYPNIQIIYHRFNNHQ
jgi:hypothetical protein